MYFVCNDLCKIFIGGVLFIGGISYETATRIWNHIFNAKTHNGDMGGEARDGSQDQQLSKGEAKRLDKAGENPEKIKQEIVGKKNSSRYDLYKDKQGNIYVKPKGGQGQGEPTGLNINNF